MTNHHWPPQYPPSAASLDPHLLTTLTRIEMRQTQFGEDCDEIRHDLGRVLKGIHRLEARQYQPPASTDSWITPQMILWAVLGLMALAGHFLAGGLSQSANTLLN